MFPIAYLITIGAILLGLFLFWRAGRRELIDSDFLFDMVLIATLGALLFGRLFEFIIRSDQFLWSLKRLIFFNVYSGFSLHGAFLGALVFGAIYAKRAKVNFWAIFDLAVTPLALILALVNLGQVLAGLLFPFLVYFGSYLMIFWVLSRLATKKRHPGFLACFYLVSFGLLNLFLPPVQNLILVWGRLPYHLIISAGFLIFGVVSWYLLAKRKIVDDFKNFLALLLLAVFRIKQILTSVEEAGVLSKQILLLPSLLAKSARFLLKLITREAVLSFGDLVKAFGFKK